MSSDPQVRLSLSEYGTLLRMAGLNPNNNGFGDLRKVLAASRYPTNYLLPNEVLEHGFSLYWARTSDAWRLFVGHDTALSNAKIAHQRLVSEYKPHG